ncbi:MAG TPA: TonB-dependent receptor [Gemmatimonadaceae bacterium]|nr:TonB-dependent receptor [Gemmatimonadaceae bacterium]
MSFFPSARHFFVAAAAMGAFALFGTRVQAQQATTTATVRGVVTGPDGNPIAGATVLATNNETGTRRGTATDERGRYQLPFLAPGLYTLRAQRIGFRPAEQRDVRLSISEVAPADFRLETSTVQLEEQRIVADVAPLIERQKTGVSTRISEAQLRDLPTNGRNFKDLVVLAPGTSDLGRTGAGGGQSIGGGRTASTNVLMDGVNNNQSFFGGDARGGDRAPFSYSIEAVKEIQVVTAGYDVERGNFTGGTVNAVTKSGTNDFRGSVFGFLRRDDLGGVRLTGNDFLGAKPTNFSKEQYGFSIGGPIVKDRAHFFVALDRQTAADPKAIFDVSNSIASQRAGKISPALRDSLIRTARSVYGWDLSRELGLLTANVDEVSAFARVDWQIDDAHTLTVRNNYLDFTQRNDRLANTATSTDLVSNAGPYKTSANSFVASLQSVFGGFTNEFRGQVAAEIKPRPSNPSPAFGVPTPQVTINNVVTRFSATDSVRTSIVFGSDPILAANYLSERTIELIDNVRWTNGDHTLKLGANVMKEHVYNYFHNNALGSFVYDSLGAFARNNATRFTRALAGADGSLPIAEFDVWETALYVQDEWQVTPRLFLSYGLRYDVAAYPTKPSANSAAKTAFPNVDVQERPSDNNNIAPRLGFTFDPNADGRQVIRGGSGLFYGRSPYVLASNVLANTGLNQRVLTCTAANTPVPNYAGYAQNPSTIPTSCTGGAFGLAEVNAFARDFEQASAWKSNLGYDRMIAEGWRVGVEAVYSRLRNQYVAEDVNLNTTPRFRIEGGIPVFAPATAIGANGAFNATGSRVNTAFNQVALQRSTGEGNSFQGIATLNGSNRWGALYAAYTFDRTRDNGSTSCCIAIFDMFNSTRAFGNPNDFSNQWGPASYSRTHSIVISPSTHLPFGILVSGIYRGYSGLPWTPIYGGDVNGDKATNDRLYVPNASETATYTFAAGSDAATLERIVAGNKCLSENRGRVIDRNACRNPWTHVLDARLSKRFATYRTQGLELVADFFNVLNGLNKEWGKRNEVLGGNQALLTPTAFTAATSRFSYRVNTTFGRATPESFLTSQFQMQLGLKYTF